MVKRKLKMENKRKHLEFVQLVITRMNVNSFLLKGWSVTLVAALFAFAAKDSDIDYVLITYISTPLFWLLDAYYLSLERQYRGLYNSVKIKEEEDIDFEMDASPFNKGNKTWLSSIFSITLLFFYGGLTAITLIIMFVIN